MTPALIGKKVGMTRIYNEKGTIVYDKHIDFND